MNTAQRQHAGPARATTRKRDRTQSPGLLMTVEQVAVLWFGEVGPGGSASSNCQRIRRLIPDLLPGRRIGNRWYVNRAVAEEWVEQSDAAAAMAHPDTTRTRSRRSVHGLDGAR